MLHNYIGDDDFRKDINVYLTKHQYKNTYTEDLWAALEEASRKPVGTVMSTWIQKMGFPVVTVSTQTPGTEHGATLTLTQSKFCADGSQSEEEHLWMIPISVSTSQNPNAISTSIVLDTKQTTITITDVNINNWIKINPGTVGFYRTQYPSDMLVRFVPAIHDKSLSPHHRPDPLDDLFALFKAVTQARWMRSNLCRHSNRKITIPYGPRLYERQLLTQISKLLGWDPSPQETHLDTLLRGLVLGRLVRLDDDDTVAEAQKRFEQHIADGPSIPADLRNACYKAVLRAGNKETYERMLKLYRSADLHEEKNRIS